MKIRPCRTLKFLFPSTKMTGKGGVWLNSDCNSEVFYISDLEMLKNGQTYFKNLAVFTPQRIKLDTEFPL